MNINTPFELAIRNQTDRFSLAIDAIDRIPRHTESGSAIREALLDKQLHYKHYAYDVGIDPPEINDWAWPL
ncbi:hypothetical protein [Acidithiobacillus caldus]|uniref:phosphoketolase family protein n=1 Tax=Acidithiobacillus caldus TaxID=33059 RepID=UPI001CF1B685|nr:hypothetical protein [Acidithiobacillus caldus]